MENKARFWNTPNGKIISHTIHEHNSGLDSLGINITLLKIYLEKKFPEALEDEKIQKALEGISNARERMKEAIDYSYNKFKERFENGE